MRRYLAVALFLICGSTSLHAQAFLTTPAEDSSLGGIRTIGLAVDENPWNKAVGAEARQRIANAVQLELRKSGLRVVLTDSVGNASSPFDALLQVEIIRGAAFEVRFVVRQVVKLARNQRELWTTTWMWDQQGYANNLDRMLADGTNAFLSKWLDANGR